MKESWIARHGTTLIALGAMLILGLVALILWRPPWTKSTAVPAGDASSPGWTIRYNAAIALARRGSPRTPLDLLDEMLDEEKQLANFSKRVGDGREDVESTKAYQTIDAALDAIVLYEEKTHDPKVGTELKAAIEKLTESPNRAMREKASRTLEKLT